MTGSLVISISSRGHGAGFFSSEGMVRRCEHGAGISAENNGIVA